MSAYNNASNKDNIVFAVVDQNTQKLDLDIFPFKDQLRYIFYQLSMLEAVHGLDL